MRPSSLFGHRQAVVVQLRTMFGSFTNGPLTGASLLLIGSLANGACGTSPTAPSAGEPARNLTGRYMLTLRPSKQCATLPDSMPTVRFGASLQQQDATFSLDVDVTLGGIRYPVTLHGSVHDNELRFETANCVRFTREAFQSDISPDETFGMCGSSVATIANPRHISGSLAGTFEYYKVDDTGRAAATACSAPDHAITLDAVID